jgi:hypothetical protein
MPSDQDLLELRRAGRCYTTGYAVGWAEELCERARADGLDARSRAADDVGMEVWIEDHPACPHCGANGCVTCKYTGLQGGELPEPAPPLLRPVVWLLFRLNYWVARLTSQFWGTRFGNRFETRFGDRFLIWHVTRRRRRPFGRLARKLSGL